MHQKYTHTSRFDYVTANVMKEYNVCTTKTQDILISVRGYHMGRYVSDNSIFQ